MLIITFKSLLAAVVFRCIFPNSRATTLRDTHLELQQGTWMPSYVLFKSGKANKEERTCQIFFFGSQEASLWLGSPNVLKTL